MDNKIITEDLKIKILNLLEKEASIRKDSITFEIQDDGQCLMIYIPIDEFPENEPTTTFQRIGYLLNTIMPSRKDDYSWFATFTRAGEIVDSYFGGNLESPNSGL